ncbi:Sec34-domain-containing protein [Agrocybe pediades]|nr:Sec34-domain-containing protein [Agrocybe pediades]
MSGRPSNTFRRGTTPASLPLTSSNHSTPNLNEGNNGSNHPEAVGAHVRVTISVEEWERRAPLSEKQQRSVNQLMKANEREKNAVPLKFAEEPGTPTPTTSVHAHRLLQQAQKDGNGHGGGSRPGTPSTPSKQGNAHTPEHALLHPSHPIQTPQQFYDWFALIDRSVAHSQEAHYRAHVASLEEHLRVCDLLVDRIDEINREVDGMMEGWKGVEEGGKSLKGACERLLEERDSLQELVEDIGSHLEYFQELEHATRMLNHPGESLIFQADFLYMVERVDICIDFLKGHRHYREAEVYLLRFQQCMTRAMTLIKMNFVGSLRALSSEISKRIADKDISPTAQHHLLYTRFKSVAAKVSPLLGELERRARSYPDELSALLAECHSAYLSTRKSLLVPRVVEEIRGLDPGRSELVELTREGCGYLKGLCSDEWGLYREFFSTGESGLYQYLETLCDLLYDDLRPRILHEPRLTVLCEVCTVLQALMVLDTSSLSSTSSSTSTDDDESSSEDGSDSDDGRSGPSTALSRQKRHSRRRSDDELTIPAGPSSPAPSHLGSASLSQKTNTARLGRRLHIGHLLKMVLQDAQTKLFFKAQTVIQSEIRHYVPKAEDLNWPGVLVSSMNAAGNGHELREKESTSQIFQNVSALAKGQSQDTWYPTLQKTVWVLSQLRDFVKPAIFDDIAQEALSYCRLSLISASELIANAGGKESKLDGALFLVRHTLILKEIWASLDAQRADAEEGIAGGSTSKKGLDVSGRSGLASGRALEFGVSAAATGGGVTETLTNMLSKTTALLPESLFASLGVTRGVESDMRGVKMDIDFTLRKACEDAIAACTNPICNPLDAWTDATMPQMLEKGSSSTTTPYGVATTAAASTVALPATSTTSDLPTLHLHFLEAVQRDLRSGVARIRLYLSDERTVRVLLEHVVERVASAYDRWGEAVGRLPPAALASTGNVEVLSPARLKEVLRDVVGGDVRI